VPIGIRMREAGWAAWAALATISLARRLADISHHGLASLDVGSSAEKSCSDKRESFAF
jgi:hypothetical protein